MSDLELSARIQAAARRLLEVGEDWTIKGVTKVTGGYDVEIGTSPPMPKGVTAREPEWSYTESVFVADAEVWK